MGKKGPFWACGGLFWALIWVLLGLFGAFLAKSEIHFAAGTDRARGAWSVRVPCLPRYFFPALVALFLTPFYSLFHFQRVSIAESSSVASI